MNLSKDKELKRSSGYFFGPIFTENEGGYFFVYIADFCVNRYYFDFVEYFYGWVDGIT